MSDFSNTPDLGRFRHRLTLQSVVTADPEPSPAGVPPQTVAETWVSGATYWAAIEPQRIRRSIGVDAPTSSLWSLVTMRNPGVPISTVTNRLVHSDGRVFVIDGVQRVDELPAYLSIEVTEVPS